MLNLPRLQFVKAFLFSSLSLLTVIGCNADLPKQGIITVLADDQIYQERPESETLWYGVLNEAQRGTGAPLPDRRGELYYQLVTDSERHLLYTKGIIPQLEELLDQDVIVKGKFITPPDDVVIGEELWPATLQLDEVSD